MVTSNNMEKLVETGNTSYTVKVVYDYNVLNEKGTSFDKTFEWMMQFPQESGIFITTFPSKHVNDATFDPNKSATDNLKTAVLKTIRNKADVAFKDPNNVAYGFNETTLKARGEKFKLCGCRN